MGVVPSNQNGGLFILYLFVYAYNVIELFLNRLICLHHAKFEKSIFKAIYFCRHLKHP